MKTNKKKKDWAKNQTYLIWVGSNYNMIFSNLTRNLTKLIGF